MNPKHFHSRANRALTLCIYNPKKLVMIHSGVTCLFSALLFFLNYWLDQGIGSTVSGLSGMGTRAILATIQSLLQLFQTIFVPFWLVGYTFASLQIARGKSADSRSLFQGFRVAGTVLGSILLMALSIIGILLLTSFLSVQVISFLPFGARLMEVAAPLLSDGMAIDEATYQELSRILMPVTIVSMAISALFAFIFSYRFRFVFFCVVDTERINGRLAVFASKKLTQGHKMDIFRLDLHFWWYYLLEFLLTGLAYGDLLLSVYGFPLPWNSTISSAVFYVSYIIGNLILAYFARNTVSVAYASLYDEVVDAADKAAQALQIQQA